MKRIACCTAIAIIILSSNYCTHTVEVATVFMGDAKAKMILSTPKKEWISFMDIRADMRIMAVIVSAGNTAHIWDLEKGTITREVKESGNSISAACLNKTGTLFATTGTATGGINIWNTSGGELVKTFHSASPVDHGGDFFSSLFALFRTKKYIKINALAFNNEGTKIIAGGDSGRLTLCDLISDAVITLPNWHSYPSHINAIAIDDDNKKIAVAGEELHSRTVMRTGYRNECASYNSNGSCKSYRNVSYTYYTTEYWSTPLAKIIDLEKGTVITIINGSMTGTITCTAFSKKGIVALGSNAMDICLFDSNTFSMLGNLPDSMYAHSISFSNDGKLLTAGCSDVYVKAWDVSAGGKMIFLTDKHNYNVVHASISNDGKYILSAGDTTIRKWSVASQCHEGLLYTIGSDEWVAVTPDGRFDGTEKGKKRILWERSGEKIKLNEFGSSFNTPGLLASILGNLNIKSTGIDVASQLVGRIYRVSGKEIIVSSGKAADLLNMGDVLFAMVDGKKVGMKVIFPMMTLAKCRLEEEREGESGKLIRGLPVFK